MYQRSYFCTRILQADILNRYSYTSKPKGGSCYIVYQHIFCLHVGFFPPTALRYIPNNRRAPAYSMHCSEAWKMVLLNLWPTYRSSSAKIRPLSKWQDAKTCQSTRFQWNIGHPMVRVFYFSSKRIYWPYTSPIKPTISESQKHFHSFLADFALSPIKISFERERRVIIILGIAGFGLTSTICS